LIASFLFLLVRGELRRSAHFLSARHGSRPAFTGARTDQITLELHQPAENGQHQSPVRCRGVGPWAHVSPRDLKPAFLAVISARVFNRSRVDRASRSNRVTASTSPVS